MDNVYNSYLKLIFILCLTFILGVTTGNGVGISSIEKREVFNLNNSICGMEIDLLEAHWVNLKLYSVMHESCLIKFTNSKNMDYKTCIKVSDFDSPLCAVVIEYYSHRSTDPQPKKVINCHVADWNKEFCEVSSVLEVLFKNIVLHPTENKIEMQVYPKFISFVEKAETSLSPLDIMMVLVAICLLSIILFIFTYYRYCYHHHMGAGNRDEEADENIRVIATAIANRRIPLRVPATEFLPLMHQRHPPQYQPSRRAGNQSSQLCLDPGTQLVELSVCNPPAYQPQLTPPPPYTPKQQGKIEDLENEEEEQEKEDSFQKPRNSPPPPYPGN